MAILVGSLIIAAAIFFRVNGKATFITEAEAKVADMDYRDLRRDSDFINAVQYIVENNCTVDMRVDGNYVYNAKISCN